MGTVRYKNPRKVMNRMIKKEETRPSLGMTEVKAEIYYVDPNMIVKYQKQARKNIDLDSLEDLASSIKSQGIIQPLQIISSSRDLGKFEVVSGERRLRAALILGLTSVPCLILDRNKDAHEIAIIENIQREDLHPIELSDAVSVLVKEKQHENQTVIAERLGISKQKMTHLLAISRLPDDIKTHFLNHRDVKISFIKKVAYLKDLNEMKRYVFKDFKKDQAFKSILRISFNGDTFRFDQAKVHGLSEDKKESLKKILLELINKDESSKVSC